MTEESKFYWNKASEATRKITKKIIEKQKAMVKADTLFFTNIYYLGKKNKIELKPLNVHFVNKNFPFKYETQSLFGNDSIFKKFLGYTNRFIGKREFILFFKEKKRYALIELDTNYSEIYLDVENIKTKDDLFKKVNKHETKINLDYKNDKIEVITSPEEKIIIDHRIPELKLN
ncbi:hypothetical protein [Tenacibaculum sp. nBUS_03]|uniref:hypothetical protein n=1 Tax=Tenacibaculum sp. nBUS_03 TaxID=3395320 RepID=UPI003EBCD185